MAKGKPPKRGGRNQPAPISRINAETKNLQAKAAHAHSVGSVQVRLQWVDVVGSVLHALIHVGGWVVIAWLAMRTVPQLAGKTTDAKFAFNLAFLADQHAATVIFAVFGLGGYGYGIAMRRLYKQTANRLKRMKELEERFDPDRTSSELRDGWKSNAEDL
jgi:hypothetical protein